MAGSPLTDLLAGLFIAPLADPLRPVSCAIDG